jgi:hypothetical protein
MLEAVKTPSTLTVPMVAPALMSEPRGAAEAGWL